MLPSANDIGWTDEAYIINMNDITEWEVNWEWLYGELLLEDIELVKKLWTLEIQAESMILLITMLILK